MEMWIKCLPGPRRSCLPTAKNLAGLLQRKPHAISTRFQHGGKTKVTTDPTGSLHPHLGAYRLADQADVLV
jgi:hypothetical protein